MFSKQRNKRFNGRNAIRPIRKNKNAVFKLFNQMIESMLYIILVSPNAVLAFESVMFAF